MYFYCVFSLADILDARLPLFEPLTQDSKVVIAEAAKTAREFFKDEIERVREWETQSDSKRDERFE